MLERATPYVEPGVNLFFRRIEKPTRSGRALHPLFWRNGAGNQSTSAWWPAYLQDIRDTSCAQSRSRPTPSNKLEPVNDDINASLCMKFLSAGQRQRQRADAPNWTSHRPQSVQNGRRGLSISHSNLHATSTELHDNGEAKEVYFKTGALGDDDVSLKENNHADQESTNGAVSYSRGPVNVPLIERQLSPTESLRALLDSDNREEYGKAWQLFVRGGDQEKLAGDVLDYLSTSHNRFDLDHAIRAYKLIPAAERGLSNYQGVIKAACHRKLQGLAVKIHHEALERGFHAQTTNTLLAFLVRNGLWKTAAQAWDRLPLSQRSAADPRNADLWHDTDQYTKLPQKLLQLMIRLEQNAAIFASDRSQIVGLGVQLLYRIFSSSDIMASITGSGTLALLDRFYHLGILKPHHYFSGMQTLNKMVGYRNRHQLATLLYRNLDSRYPKVRLPRSVLGSLLAILCESDSNHLASRVVLRRFATDWGKPDRQAYQKVMSACAQNGDFVNVREVFAEFCNDYGKPTNIVYLTPLLYVYARMGNILETRKEFNRLHSDFAIEPNSYCWNILITAHARARDHEGAFQAFQNMKRAGMKPDQHTYGILMSICARSGDTQAVHHLVELARKQHISGTTAMVDSLVHSYCLNDQVEDAENLVEAATQMHMKGSPTRMWNTLLRHHAFRADTDAVLQTQERMKELSVAADSMTYAALMQALVNIGRTRDAANILRSLHLSNAVTATVFHYSIVLYGYALENNRDMVSIIYNEMLERFPRISLSARLSRLRSYVDSDRESNQLRLSRALRGKPMSRDLRLSKTLDFLTQILLEVNQSDLATDEPQPGFGRRSPSEAFPSVYLEFLIAAFGRSGALQKAQNLLSRYQALMEVTYRKSASKAPSIHLITAIMITLVQQKRFAVVDIYWNNALSLAVDKGQQRTLSLSGSLAPADIPQPSAVRPDASGISLHTPAGILGSKPVNPFLESGDTRILAAHRYSLAAPLTQYMHSLSAQNLAANLPPLVGRLEEMGFSLSSKNWNHYIQILSYSNDADLQLLAFRIFEEKLLPNMPSWHLMKRSKWSKQDIVDGSGDFVIQEPVQRKFIERFKPHTLVPTYWTMIYLGLALMKFHQRGVQGERAGLPLLRSQAPGTVSAVSRMPYLREKAQGLLLRGRSLKGDPQKRPRRPMEADRAGLHGSRSPSDGIPLDFPGHEVEKIFKREQVSPLQQADMEQGPSGHPAEQLSGEIHRSPLVLEAAGRYERQREYLRRIRAEEGEKLRLLHQMHEFAAQPQLMADDKYGEPFFEAQLHDQQPSLAVQNATKAATKEKEALFSTAVDHFIDRKHRAPRPATSTDASDVRPAALLSAARRPKAAQKLQMHRLSRKRRPAIPSPVAAFRRNLRSKISLALNTNQPRQKIPNRLLKAFTKNKAARRMKAQYQRTRQYRSRDEKRNDPDARSSDIGGSQAFESEYYGRP